VIDDVQWADSLTAQAVQFLHDHYEHGCVVLLTVRSEEPTSQIARLQSLSLAETFRVNRLSKESTREVIFEMLGGISEADHVCDLIGDHVAGNPFFVEECTRDLVNRGVLKFTKTGSWHVRPDVSPLLYELPGTLSDVVSARVLRLQGLERKACRMASIFGRSVSVEFLALAMQRPVEHLPLEGLIRKDILEWDGPDSVRFVHDKLVEVIRRDALSCPHRCLTLHQRAARVYRCALESGRPIDRGRLAWHLQHCGRLSEAKEFYFEAFENAVQRYSFERAEALISAGLEMSPSDDLRSIRARLMFAEDVLVVQGRSEAAIAALQELLEVTENSAFGLEYAHALRILGKHLYVTGRADIACRVFGRAHVRFIEENDLIGAGRVLVNMAMVSESVRNHAEVLSIYENALSLFREAGERSYEGRTLGGMAIVLRRFGESGRARELHQESLEIAREIGDRRGQCLELGNLGGVHAEEGNYDKARRFYESAIAIALEIGDRRSAAVWLCNLGVAAQHLDELDEAVSSLKSGLALAEEVGDDCLEAVHRRILSSVYRCGGQSELARQEVSRAMAISVEHSATEEVGLCHCEKAEQSRTRGKSGEKHLILARTILKEHPLPPNSELGAAIRRLDNPRAEAFVA
jgi:tetratricopeptide (TPR) repeat protein